ncbi:MAG TPA: type II secretion system minor pseudopilin GspK [Methylomirabilota bacterium]|jgi:general secretion pathway protein K|nr:type II secretion system minor pseudopilin GspK [Methylomirabilota bacterium]
MSQESTAERGAALVIVLLAITLLTVLVVEFAYSTQIDQHLAHNAARSLQAAYLARSGVNLALLALKQDAQVSSIDALNEEWARALPPLPVGEGVVTIRVTDEQGKLNLNALRNSNGTINMQWRQTAERLFMLRGVELSLLDPVLDWLDADDFPEPRGAEKNYYLGLTPAYTARNGAFLTLGELGRVAGLTPAIRARLDEVVTVLPESANTINENTAPRDVLAALFPSVEAKRLDAFMAARIDMPSHGRNDLRERLGLPPRTQEEGVNLTNPRSEFFSIAAVATIGTVSQLLRVTVHRRAGEVIPLSWQPLPFTAPGGSDVYSE